MLWFCYMTENEEIVICLFIKTKMCLFHCACCWYVCLCVCFEEMISLEFERKFNFFSTSFVNVSLHRNVGFLVDLRYSRLQVTMFVIFPLKLQMLIWSIFSHSEKCWRGWSWRCWIWASVTCLKALPTVYPLSFLWQKGRWIYDSVSSLLSLFCS